MEIRFAPRNSSHLNRLRPNIERIPWMYLLDIISVFGYLFLLIPCPTDRIEYFLPKPEHIFFKFRVNADSKKSAGNGFLFYGLGKHSRKPVRFVKKTFVFFLQPFNQFLDKLITG